MYIGRALHGCGGISICVATSALLADWFTGKELAFAFGFNLSFCRLGSVVNNLISPRIVAERGVPAALWFGAVLCFFSLLCAVAIIPLDTHAEAVLEADCVQKPLMKAGLPEDDDYEDQSSQRILPSANQSTNEPYCEDDPHHVIPCPDDDSYSIAEQWRGVKNLSPLFWLLCLSCVATYGCVFPFNNIESSLLLERDYFMAQPNSACALDDPNACESAANQPNTACNSGPWYQPPLPVNADVNCDSDSSGCYQDYCDALSHAELQAAAIMSIPYIIVAVLCPVFGGLVDIYGQRATLLAVSPAMLSVVHALIGFTDISIVVLLSGQGFAYCIFAAVLWPSVSLVLDRSNYGIGIICAVVSIVELTFLLCSVLCDS